MHNKLGDLPIGNAAAVLTAAADMALEVCYMPGATNALQEWLNLLRSLLFIYGNSLLIVILLIA